MAVKKKEVIGLELSVYRFQEIVGFVVAKVIAQQTQKDRRVPELLQKWQVFQKCHQAGLLHINISYGIKGSVQHFAADVHSVVGRDTPWYEDFQQPPFFITTAHAYTD